MVSARVLGDLSKFDTYCTRTETLSEWINTVRHKKGVIRRQRRNRDLRVAAVLTTAIQRAETELRRKQAERAQRWAQVRALAEEWKACEAHDDADSGDGAERPRDEAARLCTSDLLGLDSLFHDLNQIKTAVAR